MNLSAVPFGTSGVSRILRKSEMSKYIYSQLYMCIQGTYAEIWTPAHCNLIGRKVTAQLLVLLPSSILPSPSYHLCFHYDKKKIGARL
jgi:hypothetical protein